MVDLYCSSDGTTTILDVGVPMPSGNARAASGRRVVRRDLKEGVHGSRDRARLKAWVCTSVLASWSWRSCTTCVDEGVGFEIWGLNVPRNGFYGYCPTLLYR